MNARKVSQVYFAGSQYVRRMFRFSISWLNVEAMPVFNVSHAFHFSNRCELQGCLPRTRLVFPFAPDQDNKL